MSINPKTAASVPLSYTKPSRKKSHSCGPCRRLKRKCDLQIPCGTCQKGRNNKIEECLANPAIPLTDTQELGVPNSKFGRVQNQSVTALAIAQRRSQSGPLEGGTPVSSSSSSVSVIQKNQHLSNNPSGSFNKFGLANSFNTFPQKSQKTNSLEADNHDQSHSIQQQAIQQQVGQEHQHLQNEHLQQQQVPSAPLSVPPQHQQLVHQVPHHLPAQQPQFQIANDASSNLFMGQNNALPPQQQLQQPFQIHHQNQNMVLGPPLPPANSQQMLTPPLPNMQHMPIHYPYRTQSLDSNQLINQNSFIPDNNRLPSAPPSSTIYIDPNDFSRLKQQADDQFQRIQSLEFQNNQQKGKIETLEHQLKDDNKGKLSFEDNKIDSNSNFLNLLPSRTQTDFLVDFYLKDIDYIYHPLHHPSFKNEMNNFWENPENADYSWLSVLFMILSLAAIHLPKGLINIDSKEIEKSDRIWFNASKDCDKLSRSSRKNNKEFNLAALQYFSLSQLYFYATKRTDELNELLVKAVNDALLMGLNKDDSENPNLLEIEMKRRLWWDICGCDTFRALSLGIKPTIKSYHSTVPYPSNANDEDITPDSIKLRSNNISTDNSFNIYRAHMMKILNGIFEKKHHKLKTSLPKLDEIDNELLKGLLEIDVQLCEFPKAWFFQLDRYGNLPHVSDIRTHFQHHMLHTSICIHRFRIYQSYLSDDVPVVWEIARSSARKLFDVYKKLRSIYDLKNPLFLPQIHQAFTGSIIQSMLLLLNDKTSLNDQTALYNDVELMLTDFEILGKDVFILKPEVLKESFKVLNDLKKILNKNISHLEKEQKDVVSDVFGGKEMTEDYFKNSNISFIVDKSNPNETDRTDENEYATYDCANQLGTLVTNELLEKSIGKAGSLDNTKVYHNININDLQNKFKSAIEINKSQSSENNKTTQAPDTNNKRKRTSQPKERTNQRVSRLMNNNQVIQNEQQQNSDKDGETLEVNLQAVDAYWNEIGQKGINALSNMYNSEFSGYRVA